MKPSAFIYLGDTVSDSADTSQYFIFKLDIATSGNLHLRHGGQANVFFADSHVDSCGRGKLVEAILQEMPSTTAIYVTEKSLPVNINP